MTYSFASVEDLEQFMILVETTYVWSCLETFILVNALLYKCLSSVAVSKRTAINFAFYVGSTFIRLHMCTFNENPKLLGVNLFKKKFT